MKEETIVISTIITIMLAFIILIIIEGAHLIQEKNYLTEKCQRYEGCEQIRCKITNGTNTQQQNQELMTEYLYCKESQK